MLIFDQFCPLFLDNMTAYLFSYRHSHTRWA